MNILCFDFQQSIVNVKPDPSEETEEEKEQKHKTFVEKYEKQIKHFGKPHWQQQWKTESPFSNGKIEIKMYYGLTPGMLRRWDDSQKYLSDNPHLVCEETANYLVIMCIDLEVEEVKGCSKFSGL